MCTVTFSPRMNGYALAMNRDELLTRPAGLPPAKIIRNGRAMICPSEPGGGTWISLNEGGVCFALINWYSITARVRHDSISRGEIIKNLGAAETSASADDLLENHPLRKTNPFRLMGFFPATQAIIEWRWDLKKLARKKKLWRMQQWISSGFDEPAAQRIRSQTFRAAQRQNSAESLDWLRRLHRSHSPAAGPFSTCMHRADAATVSYTEVIVTGRQPKMRYYAGAPCQAVQEKSEPGAAP